MAKTSGKKTNKSSVQKSQLEKFMEKFPKGDGVMLYDRTNYILMAVGVLFIIVGFILMSGGGSTDPNVFDADEIYSTRRITLAPILVLTGFIIEIAAVLKRPSAA